MQGFKLYLKWFVHIRINFYLCGFIKSYKIYDLSLWTQLHRGYFDYSNSHLLSQVRRLFLHPCLIRSSIFLPPLACGFTLRLSPPPQGASRWTSIIRINTFRCFAAWTAIVMCFRTEPPSLSFYFTLTHPYVFSTFVLLRLWFLIPL